MRPQSTSGTTALPKGATLSHRNILNNGYHVGALLNYTSADRVCIPVPLYHVFAPSPGTLTCMHTRACAQDLASRIRQHACGVPAGTLTCMYTCARAQDLASRIRQHVEYLWNLHHGLDVQATLAELPGNLRTEVLMHLQARATRARRA